jgi:prevent-host-death family protein
MKTMVVSEFKAKCTAVLREAQRTGETILVTRRGDPLARVEPIRQEPHKRRLGMLRGRMRIHGDIVQTDTADDWETLE